MITLRSFSPQQEASWPPQLLQLKYTKASPTTDFKEYPYLSLEPFTFSSRLSPVKLQRRSFIWGEIECLILKSPSLRRGKLRSIKSANSVDVRIVVTVSLTDVLFGAAVSTGTRVACKVVKGGNDEALRVRGVKSSANTEGIFQRGRPIFPKTRIRKWNARFNGNTKRHIIALITTKTMR